MRGAFLLSLGAAGALIIGLGPARAATTLSWSFATANVDKQTAVAPGVVTPRVSLDSKTNEGANLNASASASDARWGSAQAWADPGDGSIPALHASASGAPLSCCGFPSTFSVNWAGTQGVQLLTWTGGSFDFDPAWLEGTVDYNAASGLFSYINAGFALINASAFVGDPGLGEEYFQTAIGPKGLGNMFAADCGTPGALGFAQTGAHSGIAGPGSLTVGMASCGPVHLETGDTFAFWSKLLVAAAGFGLVDATHTFSIEFAPGVDPTIQARIADSVVPTTFDPGVTGSGVLPGGFGPGGSVPEPSTWALLILGFGAVGAARRAHRRISAAP